MTQQSHAILLSSHLEYSAGVDWRHFNQHIASGTLAFVPGAYLAKLWLASTTHHDLKIVGRRLAFNSVKVLGVYVALYGFAQLGFLVWNLLAFGWVPPHNQLHFAMNASFALPLFALWLDMHNYNSLLTWNRAWATCNILLTFLFLAHFQDYSQVQNEAAFVMHMYMVVLHAGMAIAFSLASVVEIAELVGYLLLMALGSWWLIVGFLVYGPAGLEAELAEGNVTIHPKSVHALFSGNVMTLLVLVSIVKRSPENYSPARVLV